VRWITGGMAAALIMSTLVTVPLGLLVASLFGLGRE
jgi:hypothetical protein